MAARMTLVSGIQLDQVRLLAGRCPRCGQPVDDSGCRLDVCTNGEGLLSCYGRALPTWVEHDLEFS